MKKYEFENVCWRYYKLLEKTFKDTLVYVELDIRNYSTFSYEFVRQLQSIGAEVDSVMKVVCGFKSTDRKTTSDYCPIILRKYSDIKERKIIAGCITICPFENWNDADATRSLFWYKAYNEIKHGRTGDFTQANLKNTLYALAGLYLLEMYYIREIAQDGEPDVPMEGSEIFGILNWNQKWFSMSSAGAFVCE